MQTEIQMRKVVAQLQPGDSVEVDHEVKVGSQTWQTKTTGSVVRTERRRHGLHHARNFDDKVWSDIVVLKRESGDLTTVTVDEYTQVRVIS